MRKKIHLVLLIILSSILVLSSCSTKIEKDNHTNQLYATLASSFNYYYSMDLWSFTQVLEGLNDTSANSENESIYLMGYIDHLLAYSPFYSHSTFTGQRNLEVKVIPEEINDPLGSFFAAENKFLKYVRLNLSENKNLFVLDDFNININELIADINSLNINVSELKDQIQINEYCDQLNKVTELMNLPETDE